MVRYSRDRACPRPDKLRYSWLAQDNWRCVVLLSVSAMMLLTTVLPWLKDPLGDAYSAWSLRIEFSWWMSSPLTSFLNYGLLCMLCAVYVALVAYASVKPFRWSANFGNRYISAAVVCMLPIAIFCVQYLVVDIPFMAQLAQREIQLLLIQQHFGYHAAAQRIGIHPLTLDISSMQQRFVLLFDQASFGLGGPCLSCWILIEYYRRHGVLTQRRTHTLRYTWRGVLGIVCLLIFFGRAPLGMFCETQANGALAAGNYVPALQWLDAALFLNPLLDRVASFHKERGQALYFLHNSDEQNDDVRVYLASSYRNQGNLFDAYQQLLATWKTKHSVAWGNEDLVVTLEMLAESKKPLKVQPHVALDTEEAALQWLQILTQVDASNVYGHYGVGRINYELHDYKGCVAQMQNVQTLSTNLDIQSSVYTYIGLSEGDQGRYALSRDLLLQAVKLDPYYRNNVAREELSGLR